MPKGLRVGLVLALLVVSGAAAAGLWLLLSPASDDGEAGGSIGGFTTVRPAAGQTEVLLHPLAADGAAGEPLLVYRGPGDLRTGPLPIDGVGTLVLLGSGSEGAGDQAQVRAAGDGILVRDVPASTGCSAAVDGPDFIACLLLDEQRLLRTTTIAPGLDVAASVMVDDLAAGEQVAQFGPFPALEAVLGTTSADTVLLVQAGAAGGDVVSLDLASGATTTVGRYDEGWVPLCAIGTGDALGVQVGDGRETLGAIVRSVPAVSWSSASGWRAGGCSADGRFAYLVSTVDGGVAVDRVSLDDGQRARVLDDTAGFVGVWTR